MFKVSHIYTKTLCASFLKHSYMYICDIIGVREHKYTTATENYKLTNDRKVASALVFFVYIHEVYIVGSHLHV